MSAVVRLHFESRLAAPVAAVLRKAFTMPGVNAELRPLLRMTYPREFHLATLHGAPLRHVVFRSWLLLFGVVPVDRHAMAFDRVLPNGFDEHSTSWLQRDWIHRRRIEPYKAGTRLIDDVEFQPRWRGLTPLLRFFVTAMFRNRHRQLQRRYGLAPD